MKNTRHKIRIAFYSVLVGVTLTGIKIAVGLLSGSLGILSEALHSLLDLVAALITFISVRISEKPPDEQHPYGHGKIENLSALAEALLLLARSEDDQFSPIGASRLGAGHYFVSSFAT